VRSFVEFVDRRRGFVELTNRADIDDCVAQAEAAASHLVPERAASRASMTGSRSSADVCGRSGERTATPCRRHRRWDGSSPTRLPTTEILCADSSTCTARRQMTTGRSYRPRGGTSIASRLGRRCRSASFSQPWAGLFVATMSASESCPI
jgi:hypothetical protein